MSGSSATVSSANQKVSAVTATASQKRKSTESPKEALLHVLDMVESNPKQVKLTKGGSSSGSGKGVVGAVGYAPFYGVTCVMHLNHQSHYESFSKPLFDLISKDKRVTTAMALLPPSSYHVTLRGLEACLKGMLGGQSAVVDAGLAKFQATQDHLNQLFTTASSSASEKTAKKTNSSSSVFSLTGDVFTMQITGQRRLGSFSMQCCGPTVGGTGGTAAAGGGAGFESVLREGEQILLNELLDPACGGTTAGTKGGAGARQQAWHLTLGYDLTKDSALLKTAGKAIDEALMAVVGASGGAAMPPLNFVAPQICYYYSMEHFEPLFK